MPEDRTDGTVSASFPAIAAEKVGKVATFYVDGVAIATISDGTDGATGTTFTPSVSEEGVISWTNDGGKQNPTPRNIKGSDGDPTALIDDTSTAQNRTWSAKKLDEEKSSLMTEINSTGFSVVDGKLCMTYTNEEESA